MLFIEQIALLSPREDLTIRQTASPSRHHDTVIANRMTTSFSPQTWSLLPTAGRASCRAFFIATGRASLVLADDRRMELEAPSVAWIPRGLGNEFRLEAGGSGIELRASEDAVWRSIGDSAFAADLKFLLEEVALASGNNMPLRDVHVGFDAISREARDPRPGSSSIIGLNLSLILLHLWRAVGVPLSPPQFPGSGAGLVQRFRQLVEVHFREGLRIEDYADQLGVTRGRLHDACVRSEGTPPLAIVHARVIEEAQRRLTQTQMPVEQVAYSLGFRDASYFNRFFTRLTGVTPGVFRKTAMRANRPADTASFAAWP